MVASIIGVVAWDRYPPNIRTVESQRHPELQPGDGGPRRDGDGDHPGCRLRAGRGGHGDAAHRFLLRVQPPRRQPGDGVERQPGQVHPSGRRLLHLHRHRVRDGRLPHLLRHPQGHRAGRLPRGRRFQRHGGGSQHSESQRHPELQPGDGGPRRDGDGDHPGCRLRAGRRGHGDAAHRFLLRVQPPSPPAR